MNLVVICFVTYTLIPTSSGDDFTHLTILHSNDIHGNFAGDDNGFGGVPKLIHVVKKIKAVASPGNPVIYVNAGDIFTGTVWYSIHRTNIAADFVNLMKADALTLGNHEFDEGLNGLEHFGSKIKQPLLCANGNFTEEPGISKYIKRSIVFKPNNCDHEIGIIGYINSGTGELTGTGGIHFVSDIDAVREEAKRLTEEGVKVIIALGHSGIEIDKKIAEVVPEVDIVVGGHSHTFLYTGNPPTKDSIYGDYPVVVQKPNGVNVPVVQVGYGGKYLGRLNTTIDSTGNVLRFEGNPIVLDSEVAQDEDALELLEYYRPEVDAVLGEIVGNTNVYLQGGLNCRRLECNLGNLLTDSFCVYKADMMVAGPHWTDTPIGIINGGALRNSINASKRTGHITKGDMMGCLPFANNLVSLGLNTSSLLNLLEFSVKSNGETSFGEFFQVSGLRVTFDINRPPLKRVVSVFARCGACDVPAYEPIKENSVYRLVTTQYLAKGGDGYKILKEAAIDPKVENITDFSVLLRYLKEVHSVQPSIEERIRMRKHNYSRRADQTNGSESVLSVKNRVLHVFVSVCVIINW